MLELIEREQDAQLGLVNVQTRAAFATLLEDPQATLTEMLKMITKLCRHRDGDPMALLSSGDGQSLQMVEQLWRAMQQQGMLNPTLLK